MLQAIIGALCGVGLFFVLADVYRIPYLKTSKAVESLSKKQKVKTSTLNVWLGNLADFLAKHMKLNEFKKAQLEADLKTAQMDITPEKFKANAIVKALLIGIFAIPMAFIFPILSPVVLFLAVFLYRRELKSVSVRIRHKREKIESELPRLVFTIDKTLKHSRDVLYMLESYHIFIRRVRAGQYPKMRERERRYRFVRNTNADVSFVGYECKKLSFA